MTMPPGVSEQTFAQAIAEFRDAVGAEWVFTSDEDIGLYRDAYSPLWNEPEERMASAAVAPETVEQVQAVVRIANRHGIPLYPISTGRNLGYGGAAPAMTGSVVVDLKRMNRVLEISEDQASILVEPGVSYFEAYEYIQERGLKLWLDVPDPGWGSLVGNALDRGLGNTMTQYRNHFDAHCGMEIVLPDGEVLRTGMGAMPSAETWQQYKAGYGPWIDGIFSQSSYGIVTKMGFWLMPQPEAYATLSINAYRYGDLDAVIKLMTKAESLRMFHGNPDLHSPLLGTPGVNNVMKFVLEGPPPVPKELLDLRRETKLGYSADIEAYALREEMPYWQLDLVFYGAPELIEGSRAALRRMFSAIPDAAFVDSDILSVPFTDEQRDAIHPSSIGQPSLKIFSVGTRSNWNDAPPTHGHLWFSPIIPRTAEAVIEANRVFGELSRELNVPAFGLFSLPYCFFERAFTFIQNFPVTEDPDQNRQMRANFERFVDVAAEQGWAEYRTPVAFQDKILSTFSFNDHILRRFHEQLKDAVDPKGIISPGRYGIWPAHMRAGQRADRA